MNKFEQFVNRHCGELVIDGFEVLRLVGFVEDDEDNWFLTVDWQARPRQISCVSRLIVLKGVLSNNEYRVFPLNYECWSSEGGPNIK